MAKTKIKEHKFRPTVGQIAIARSNGERLRVVKVLSNGCRIGDLDGIDSLEVTWRVFSENYDVEVD
jgi:hypothetical protein